MKIIIKGRGDSSILPCNPGINPGAIHISSLQEDLSNHQEAVSNVCSIELLPEIVRAPTTKAVGSKDVTKLEPTALVVGLQKIEVSQTFETASNLSVVPDETRL
jgi:hypothetical protein